MGLFSRTLSRLEELKKALTRDPASRQFLALADEYRKQGQTREAIAVLERGLEQDPSAVAGHVALGRLLQQGGRLDEALASFHAALRLDPQNLVALRQTADVHLSRGDTVEAIKKLKLFRGLSPGDREVNDLIRQLGIDLAAAGSPRPPIRTEKDVPTPPAPEFRTGGIPVQRARPAASTPFVVTAPVSALPAVPPLPTAFETGIGHSSLPADHSVPFGVSSGPEPFGADDGAGADTWPGLAESTPARASLTAPAPDEGLPFSPTVASIPPLSPAPPALPEVGFESSTSPFEEAAGSAFAAVAASSAVADAPAVPAVTETLAALLHAQGHLGEARVAYQELARTEADPDRSRRFHVLAEEISVAWPETVRGRLGAWVAPFSRSLGRRDIGLSGAVEELVDRLGYCAAVVTDFEGVPVVDAGPRSEAEAMENLAAELTAFWKNVRRSRAEIGEGALDSLILSGVAGSVAVKAITPGYALLLKVGPDVPAGRVRFEAARAAEKLRPGLV